MKRTSEDASTSRVLLRQSQRAVAGQPLPNRERILARLATAGGAALALIGITDVALLWIPPRLGNAEWEFATISATFESLPLAALGFGLLAVGSIVKRGRVGLYLLAAVFAALTLLVVGSATLFALDVPLALKAAPAPMKSQLIQHFLKTGILALAYLFLFAYLTWISVANARTDRTA
jgi:hypothetical protein